MSDPFAEVNRRFEEQRKRLEESLRELKAKPAQVTDVAPPPVETVPVQPQPKTSTIFSSTPVSPTATTSAQVPAVQPQPSPPPQTNQQDVAQVAGLNKIIMEQGVAIMLSKVGQALSQEEQEWLSANLISLPGFLSSNSGKAVVKLLFSEYKSWMEK